MVSRQPDSVPDFLVVVAKHLSDASFTKVRTQWEYFMVFLAEATCKKENVEVGEWALSTQGTCLFYRSNHLPCQHLMYIGDRVHRFKCLSAFTVAPRWDMLEMAAMEKAFQAGIDSLRVVQTSMKVASDAFDAVQPEGPASTLSATRPRCATHEATREATQLKGELGDAKTTRPRVKPKHRVIYVKLRRRERANVVVMSAEEKYCYAKAVFEPVMERLSGLSSPAFCTALQAWKELVQRGLREGVGGGSVSDTTTSPDKDDETDKSNVSDAASGIEPMELIDTIDFMRQMEPLNATQTGEGVIHKFAMTKEPTPSATQTLNVCTSHVGCRGNVVKRQLAFTNKKTD
ncbi:hypothetical protein PPTG_08749 [Phytophthora nicotianae INRA-310]|uniref:SWIM-type domain-containing protein n=1 Tax=Phytophthora nicotianae (strain INRA-310) TaxID=761204 RepID=W2QJB9_PHYN3|nr:hypothetical protein PPTG_08749 [Phytophthora nicotianae INRA-310]ETN12669.1 hypothetical protein PPTG_08749 [Phytophthora nicotianae INRA-310]